MVQLLHLLLGVQDYFLVLAGEEILDGRPTLHNVIMDPVADLSLFGML